MLVASPCGEEKSGVAVVVGLGEGESLVQKPLHELKMTATRSLKDRCVVLVVALLKRAATTEEGLDDIAMASIDSIEESGVANNVTAADVGLAVVEEVGDEGEMTTPCSVVEAVTCGRSESEDISDKLSVTCMQLKYATTQTPSILKSE